MLRLLFKGANLFLIICLAFAALVFTFIGFLSGVNRVTRSADKHRVQKENYGVH